MYSFLGVFRRRFLFLYVSYWHGCGKRRRISHSGLLPLLLRCRLCQHLRTTGHRCFEVVYSELATSELPRTQLIIFVAGFRVLVMLSDMLT
jgi:hypothetical protein